MLLPKPAAHAQAMESRKMNLSSPPAARHRGADGRVCRLEARDALQGQGHHK